jgi:ComF family protein
LDSACAALDYGFPWSGLISQWKFGHRLELGRPLAGCMLGMSALQEPGAAAHFDLLIPVPLAARRLRARGFNQSWELARRLARWLDIPGDAHLLRRCRDTPAQSLLSATDRAHNLIGAFGVPWQLQAKLAGRRVVLIDDVMTTGATAFEAARTLRSAGAAEVHLWILARTPEPARASAPGSGDNHQPCSASFWSSPRSRPTPAT